MLNENRVLPQTLAGKSAIVTGAGMGIGRVTAIELAGRGASVLISDISDKDLAEVAEVISAKGGTVETLRVDVTVQADIERLVANAVSSFGKLDIAFNNAGVSGSFGPLLDQTNDDWNLVINTNLRSTFWAMQAQARIMLEQGFGSIINNASISSIVGIHKMPVYTASKHAVMGITKSAAIEWFKQGVRVNAVCPGWVWTAIQDKLWDNREQGDAAVASQPQGRWGNPEEIAKIVAFLASDDASLMSGHGVVVDGGFTIA